jgi:hypothetical protein
MAACATLALTCQLHHTIWTLMYRQQVHFLLLMPYCTCKLLLC